jgi:hypothetical protein
MFGLCIFVLFSPSPMVDVEQKFFPVMTLGIPLAINALRKCPCRTTGYPATRWLQLSWLWLQSALPFWIMNPFGGREPLRT